MKPVWVKELSVAVLSIALVSVAAAGSLRLLKQVPPLLFESSVHFYASVEDAELAHGTAILLPSFFPDLFRWPPSEIKAVRQGKTLIASLTFLNRRDERPGMIIHQIFGESSRLPENLDEPVHAEIAKEVQVNGIAGILAAGASPEGERWVQLSWKMPDRAVIVTARCPSETLLMIAQSIH